MKNASVTVFVRDRNGFFVANTYGHDAMDKESDLRAARKCAARHLGVAETRVALIPDAEHPEIFVAFVQEPRPPMPWGETFAILAVVLLALAAVLLVRGGMQ